MPESTFRSTVDPEAAGKPQLAFKLIDLLARVSDRVVPWLLLAAALYWLQDMAASLTQQESGFGTWLALMGQVRVTRFFAFIFGLCGVFYGLQQRNLRRAELRRLQGRISQLEALVLPGDSRSIPKG